jgi:hypothetical protein
MKIALYIEDGLEQIVLTPESDTEKGIVGKLHDGSREMSIYRGEFYACQGGWTRHRQFLHGGGEDRGASTIIVLRETPKGSPDRTDLTGDAGAFIP